MDEKYLKIYQENDLDITFYEFVFLVLINEQSWDILHKIYQEGDYDFHVRVKSLEEKGYVKWYGPAVEHLTFRTKGEDLFKKVKKLDKSDVHSWINEWRNLFPEGVNNSGYRYRGSRLECLKKMIKFVASYPFSKEEIFEATKRYIERFSVRGYLYMQQAHYFIEKKETGSNLASECESLKETQILTESTNYGGKVI